MIDGYFETKKYLRVTRKGKEVYFGKVGSLRRVKDVVKKVESGLECGIGADPEWDGFKAGDVLECLDLVDKIQTLETASENLQERVEEYQAGEADRQAAREKAKEGYQRQQRRGAPAPRNSLKRAKRIRLGELKTCKTKNYSIPLQERRSLSRRFSSALFFRASLCAFFSLR